MPDRQELIRECEALIFEINKGIALSRGEPFCFPKNVAAYLHVQRFLSKSDANGFLAYFDKSKVVSLIMDCCGDVLAVLGELDAIVKNLQKGPLSRYEHMARNRENIPPLINMDFDETCSELKQVFEHFARKLRLHAHLHPTERINGADLYPVIRDYLIDQRLGEMRWEPAARRARQLAQYRDIDHEALAAELQKLANGL